MCGAAFFFRGAGRGQGKNPRGGVGQGKNENPRGGEGVNRLIPKILQNCVNEKYNITYYDNNYKMLS